MCLSLKLTRISPPLPGRRRGARPRPGPPADPLRLPVLQPDPSAQRGDPMNDKKYLKWYNKVGYGSGDIAGKVADRKSVV